MALGDWYCQKLLPTLAMSIHTRFSYVQNAFGSKGVLAMSHITLQAAETPPDLDVDAGAHYHRNPDVAF